MTDLYPEIEPYEQGFLEVGDGNSIYWETCGNPAWQASCRLAWRPWFGMCSLVPQAF